MFNDVLPFWMVLPRALRPDKKRVFDIVVVMLCAPIWLPLLIGVICLVRLYQGPGVFFVQPRVGRNGRMFRMVKIRTMIPDAEVQLSTLLRGSSHSQEWVQKAKLSYDPRCTPLGRWLRRYSFDELPQILNILRGEMGVIGPRPVPWIEFRTHYTGSAADAYLTMRPGLSGLWQVFGRNGCFRRRVQIDTEEALSQGLGLDCRILLRTFSAVIRGTGC